MNWRDGLSHKDWLFDGGPIRGEYAIDRFNRLDWSKAWVDIGPSIAGNLGPYWHVPMDDDDTVHRLYPKVLAGKWLLVIRQACIDYAARQVERSAAQPQCAREADMEAMMHLLDDVPGDTLMERVIKLKRWHLELQLHCAALSGKPGAECARDAIIEECAKVAGGYPPPEGVTDDYQSGFIDAICFIEDAIRALSGKPGAELDELRAQIYKILSEEIVPAGELSQPVHFNNAIDRILGIRGLAVTRPERNPTENIEGGA